MIKMKSTIIIFIVFILVVSTLAKNEEYMGYKVYKIKLTNESQQNDLYKLKSDIVDFWRKPCAKYNVIGKAMVPPSHIDWFEEQLREIGVANDIFIDDVHTYLAEREQKSTKYHKNESNNLENNDNSEENDEKEIACKVEDSECSDEGEDNNKTEEDDIVFDFESFYRYDVILAHLYAVQGAFANSTTTVKVVVYGHTEENRPLVYLKLTNGDEADKPVIVIESAINPRDWITVPSALNVVNRLLEEDNKSLLDNTVWIIVPVLNPDGYEYTHTNLRLWTKSRSVRSNLGFICPGVNLDRNFDIDWKISDSSSSPCSHLFAGIGPFSEIETQMIKHIIEEYTPVLYISLQSTGKFITYPWRYEKAASGLFRPHLLQGLDIVDVLDGYTLDSGAITIGDRESGTSVDYARLHRVYFTYNLGIDGEGDDGVLIPEEDIKRISEDVWRAVAAACKNLTAYIKQY